MHYKSSNLFVLQLLECNSDSTYHKQIWNSEKARIYVYRNHQALQKVLVLVVDSHFQSWWRHICMFADRRRGCRLAAMQVAGGRHNWHRRPPHRCRRHRSHSLSGCPGRKSLSTGRGKNKEHQLWDVVSLTITFLIKLGALCKVLMLKM